MTLIRAPSFVVVDALSRSGLRDRVVERPPQRFGRLDAHHLSLADPKQREPVSLCGSAIEILAVHRDAPGRLRVCEAESVLCWVEAEILRNLLAARGG